MLINFPNIHEVVKPHLRGGEKDTYMKKVEFGASRTMIIRLEPGASIGEHTHEQDCEVFYYLSGHAKCLYDGKWEPVEPGTAHFCPKGHSHSLVNSGDEDLVLFAAVIEQ